MEIYLLTWGCINNSEQFFMEKGKHIFYLKRRAGGEFFHLHTGKDATKLR